MNAILWGFSALYFVAVCLLLAMTRRRRHYALTKGIVSGLFLVAGILAWFTGSGRSKANFALLLGALVLCAVGDVMLGLANQTKHSGGQMGEKAASALKTPLNKKNFLLGAGCFLVAHLLFCVLFALKSPFRWFDILPPLVFVGLLLFLERAGAVRLKRMRPLAVVYTFLVGLMAWKAVGVYVIGESFSPQGMLLLLGALLFLVSDVVLLFLYFGTKRRKALRYVNLSTYYVGVYLLALSAFWQ